ncbi:MAG: efflux RND transporter periplasmic adaptor subunit [Beijerinckiaceae bacterium]
MKRAGRTGLTLAALLAVGAAGYWAGHRDLALSTQSSPKSWLHAIPWLERAASIPASADSAPLGPVLYYRDPDGGSTYSAVPRKTDNGRDFLPVYASKNAHQADAPAPVSETEDSGKRKKILYYRNPMGLPDTSPVPKKDSMGMDYIPVYEGNDDGGPVVKVAQGRLQRTGVRSEPVARRVIVTPIRMPGTITLDERRVAVVATRSDAFIDKVENVTTGDRVTKGQPLLHLYSPEIVAAGAQLVSFPGFEGSRRRLENLNVSPEVIAEIERTRKVPPTITWSSPLDGVVLERNAIEGMKAAAGQTMFRVADLSTMWVLADVPEHDIDNLQIHMPATVRVRGLPGRTFTGKIDLIYPQVKTATRTTPVRIELANPDGVLRPDMYADVEIAAGASSPVVAVPDSAVIDTGERQVVILDKGDGRFEPRDVKIGTQGGGYTEIRSGVASDDRVVVTANFLIDAESNLKAALRGMKSTEDAP